MLAVNRPYHRADYIPCIFWGRTAMLAGECCVGDEIALRGRFQSRNYLKVLDQHSEKRTAYEVSVMSADF
jgi:single-stranded DNA-binding protein